VSGRSTTDAEGYVEDIPYTYGYQPDLDPLRMQAALRGAGIEPPTVATACELGFGQGLSVAIHAVAGGARWYGTDINPAHVATLQGLVAGTGADVEAFAQSFAGFCARDDLPPFDFIGLHGVWSWVSAANRRRILRFVERRLRPGGALYLSYNALPGWAAMLPLRAALVEHAAALPVALPLEARIESAMAHVGARVLRDADWVDAHPGIEAEWRAIRHKDIAYLAHEFFNRDWAPMAPQDVAAALGGAGLEFAAFASDVPPAETARFRREYWVKVRPEPGRGGGADAAVAAAGSADRRADVQRLNDRLLALATRSPGPAWLADPVTGGAVEVGYAAMLMLEAWRRGITDPVALAREAEASLARLGQRLVRDGEVVVEPAQVRSRLEAEARGLLAVTLPRLRGAGALP
jgi:SAM-dependent methyltransferase